MSSLTRSLYKVQGFHGSEDTRIHLEDYNMNLFSTLPRSFFHLAADEFWIVKLHWFQLAWICAWLVTFDYVPCNYGADWTGMTPNNG
jgi:hypothetical protein